MRISDWSSDVCSSDLYADEGADQLKAYQLAVKHLNEGGGMLETLKPSSLKGNGVLGRKVEYVQGDAQTNPDAARAAARRMIERDGIIMFSGELGRAACRERVCQYV